MPQTAAFRDDLRTHPRKPDLPGAALRERKAAHVARAKAALTILNTLGLDGVDGPEATESAVCMAGRRADLLCLFASHLKDACADDAADLLRVLGRIA
jgi:hypothetical protein